MAKVRSYNPDTGFAILEGETWGFDYVAMTRGYSRWVQRRDDGQEARTFWTRGPAHTAVGQEALTCDPSIAPAGT